MSYAPACNLYLLKLFYFQPTLRIDSFEAQFCNLLILRLIQNMIRLRVEYLWNKFSRYLLSGLRSHYLGYCLEANKNAYPHGNMGRRWIKIM